MKRLYPILLLLALVFGASAQSPTNRISLTIVVTNRAVTGNNLVVNSSTRTWTNASTATTILTNLVSTATTATNLYNQIAGFPYSGGIFPRWLSETSMVLTAPLGGALAASQVGAWSILTLSTQSGPQTFTALWPIENIVVASNRTNQGSSLVAGLSQFSTNAFATNSTATSNHITKGASPDQFITSPLRVTGTLRATSQLLATNGYTSALTNINSVSSNHINYGNAIRSEGSGGNSLQVGSNALARGDLSVAIGNGAVASNTTTVAIGTDAKATNDYAMAIGNSAVAGTVDSLVVGRGSVVTGLSGVAVGQGAGAFGPYDMAFGSGAEATGGSSLAVGGGAVTGATNAVAIGPQATSIYTNSVALGAAAASTVADQVRLGTATHTVSIPGVLSVSGTQTNTTFRGTNVVNGRVDFTSRANTALVNGANSAIVLGTNVYVRLSGATTVAGISGFAAEQDGSFHIVQITGAITNVIVNEANSTDIATDAAAANRIVTGTGTNFYATNSPLVIPVVYDGTAGRWRMMNFLR